MSSGVHVELGLPGESYDAGSSDSYDRSSPLGGVNGVNDNSASELPGESPLGRVRV